MDVCRAFDLFEFTMLVIWIILLALSLIISIITIYAYCKEKTPIPEKSRQKLPFIQIVYGVLIGLVISVAFAGCVIGMLEGYVYIKSMFC